MSPRIPRGGDPEETWDPQIARWHDPEGDHVLPRALRTLPEPWEPWDEGDWNRIAGLPHTDERLLEAQRVITALLEDPELSPCVSACPARAR
ncbi:hypothetical protein ACFYOA_12815 [Streptomyces iakyrus]|uniref:hypothetical protein n=1 Tax=Streptomyces iakyrus TaxID=68219 RepID=UPI0036B7DB1C